MEALSENFFPQPPDREYLRRTRHVVIASVESLVPLRHSAGLDPDVYGGGTGDYTWRRVQRFFALQPQARKNQMPMHYYGEFLQDDYVFYVGLAATNRSWFLQEAVDAGVLRPEYADAVLVVLQENFGVENVERRMWRLLADRVLSPIMRERTIMRDRVVFFENLADREAVAGPNWPYRFREPSFLDPRQLELYLKEYEKR